MSNKDVKKYVNARGDFEFPKFLYSKHNALMKSMLDLGNLACQDANQLRAFKERVKKDFKSTWKEYADILFEHGIVEKCGCESDVYCQVCGGARYIPIDMLNADVITESIFMTTGKDPDLLRQLRDGLLKAQSEVNHLEGNRD